MRKSIIKKYLDKPTDIYHLVDDEFLNCFNEKQRPFMLMQYYEYYKNYCDSIERKPESINSFLKNAKRKKIKIIQECCPYCGSIDIQVQRLKCSELNEMSYCVRCGGKSTAEYIFLQLSAFIRIEEVHKAGIETLKKSYDSEQMRIICYDVYHMELITLTSILEKTLRDFYINLSFLKLRKYNEPFLDNIIRKNTNNDFMLWDKANNHYKKAFDINFKELVSEECRQNLSDLVNIRNSIIHNNGMLDEHFRKTSTYDRIKNCISGDLIFVTEDMILNYLSSVLELISAVEKKFNNMYKKEMYNLIANYYFV